MAFRVCCGCKPFITIRRLDHADGKAVWEYGPGANWVFHYGSDTISGMVVPSDTAMNRRVQNVGTSWTTRSGMTANAAEAVTLTKLDATDGTVIESALIPGMWVVTSSKEAFTTMHSSVSIAGLSGGDIVFKENRKPTLELVDWTNDIAAKQYVIHSNNQVAGNITLVTKTSSETVTIACNSSASAAATAITAGSPTDIVSVSVTGGPLPETALEIAITWSAASGDFKSINASTTYTVSGTSVPANGILTAYSTSTGEITGYLGSILGAGASITRTRLITGTDTIPTSSAPPSLGLFGTRSVFATASDGIMTVSSDRTLQYWTLGKPFTRGWAKFVNAVSAGTTYGNVENDAFIIGVPRKNYGSGVYSGCVLTPSSGAVTEYDVSDVKTDDTAAPWLHDSSATDYITQPFTEAGYSGAPKWCYTDGNTELTLNGDHAHIQGQVYGVTSGFFLTHTFASTTLTDASLAQLRTIDTLVSPLSGLYPNVRHIAYHVGFNQRSLAGTEFRIVFSGTGLTTVNTPWLDWNTITATDLRTELLTLFPENPYVGTTGWSTATVLVDNSNNCVAPMFEKGYVVLDFYVAQNATGLGLGFMPRGYVTDVNAFTFEFRNFASAEQGVARWENSTSSPQTWAREWGRKRVGGLQVLPTESWVKNGIIVSWGQAVRGELPPP